MKPKQEPIEQITIGAIRKDLNVYNKTINNYVRTFDLFQIFQANMEPKILNGIRDSNTINKKLFDFLFSHKDKIKEFEKDYYKYKTILEVSKKIGIDTQIIIDYIQERLCTFLILRQKEIKEINKNVIMKIDGDANYICPENKGLIHENTILFKMSSYELYKKIQAVYIKKIIQENSN